MTWDLAVDGRLFVAGLAAVWLGLIVTIPSIAFGQGTSVDFTGVLPLLGAILLILSYVFGRTPEERSQARPTTSS
jgi:peptidoglycan/LPS O-acetylase OafA/YrhL